MSKKPDYPLYEGDASFQTKLDKEMIEELDEIVKQTGLSRDGVVYAIFDKALNSSKTKDEIFNVFLKTEGQQKGGKCRGRPCNGVGNSGQIIPGACPPGDPPSCPAAPLAVRDAKDWAKINANADCPGECNCENGNYTDITPLPKCTTVVLQDGTIMCAVRVRYRYAGECVDP